MDRNYGEKGKKGFRVWEREMEFTGSGAGIRPQCIQSSDREEIMA